MPARDLDDPGLAASHSAVSRELRAVMETIASGVRTGGKLMLLTEQAQRGADLRKDRVSRRPLCWCGTLGER